MMKVLCFSRNITSIRCFIKKTMPRQKVKIR